MTSNESAQSGALTQALATLTTELARVTESVNALSERVGALEATGPVGSATQGGTDRRSGSQESSSDVTEEIDEQTLVLISAAIAAFLGKTPRIRQIRLRNTASWAQEGRATIHASHALTKQPRPGAFA